MIFWNGWLSGKGFRRIPFDCLIILIAGQMGAFPVAGVAAEKRETSASSAGRSESPSAPEKGVALPRPDLFQIEFLDVPGGGRTTVTDINNAGVVLGEGKEGEAKRPCKWADGKFSLMSGFHWPYAAVYAINDEGVIAGAHVFSDKSTAYIQDGDEVTEMKSDVRSAFRLPYGINSNRQIIGVSFHPMNVTSSWIWDAGKITAVPTLGGWSSEAMSINDKGQVVGFSTVMRNRMTHAFLFDGRDIQDLGTLGGSESRAYDVNEIGHVVGFAHDRRERKRGFLWASEKIQELGALPGGSNSWAWSINNSGWSVGWSDDGSGGQRAVVWHNGQVYDLNELTGGRDRWTLAVARAVNDAGLIAGTAIKGNQQRAFVLKPRFKQD